MNGFIKRTVAVLSLGGAAAVSGCCSDKHLCDYYDNCWMTRYGMQAEQPVRETFAAQISNGHVLEQTVFTYHFDSGTDKLNKGGQEHLAFLARRRPQPDCVVFLQSAQDVTYDAAAP